jgi:hypothetical protein
MVEEKNLKQVDTKDQTCPLGVLYKRINLTPLYLTHHHQVKDSVVHYCLLSHSRLLLHLRSEQWFLERSRVRSSRCHGPSWSTLSWEFCSCSRLAGSWSSCGGGRGGSSGRCARKVLAAHRTASSPATSRTTSR